jgi:hypothetical protein
MVTLGLLSTASRDRAGKKKMGHRNGLSLIRIQSGNG